MSADHYSFRDYDPDPAKNRAAIQEACDLMKENGAVDFRVTFVDEHHRILEEGGTPHGIWIEGWKTKQGPEWPPFEPPLTQEEPQP